MRFWDSGSSGSSGSGSTPPPNNPIIKVVGLDAAGRQYPLSIGSGLAIVDNVLDLATNIVYSAEAQAYFGRLTGTYTSAWKIAVDNQLIKPLVANGIWGLRDVIYHGHTANFADSQINLKSNTFPLTLTGAITNSLVGGWDGNGGSFSSAYTAQNGQYTQNNGGFDAWLLEQNVNYNETNWYTGVVCGFYVVGGTTNISFIQSQIPDPFLVSPLASKTAATHHSAGSASDYASIVSIASGFIQVNRSSATEFNVDFGDTSQLIASNSVTPDTNVFRIMPYGFGGRVAFVSAGASLNATQRAAYRTIVGNFLTAIGAS